MASWRRRHGHGGGATRVEEVRAQGGWAARGQEPVPAEIAFAPIAVLQSPIR